MLLGESLSLVFGLCNLVLWGGIAIPQIYKNYKNKSSDAVSYFLYYQLLIGGIISLCIANIKGSNITIIYVGIHHLVITTILMLQLLYYRIEDIYMPLTAFETEVTCTVTTIVIILLIYVTVYKDILLIEMLAWCSSILFMTSKMSQIYNNNSRQSVKGLSLTSFVCMVFTDSFFIMSILINIIDEKESIVSLIYRNIQWLLSCAISLISTFVILCQFKYYNTEY